MKLAAIDIGTNSIHMIVVDAIAKHQFGIIEREKEMVKLGAGVFATQQIDPQTFGKGLETIHRYVHLADQLGAEAIITAATSAIREARNGDKFLSEVVTQTGLAPRMISGREEARLIFLAVRNAIAIQDQNVLVLDIGGGSTEAAIGNCQELLYGSSMKLGVQRLLDMFEDEGTIGSEAQGVLEAHIRLIARKTLDQALSLGFDRVIGTSGTIRTLGEAAHLAAGGNALQSVNAEVVSLNALQSLTQKLLSIRPDKRAKISGISDKRADTIHLGGVLLTQLLQMAKVQEITLCDASLREGLILDYLDRRFQQTFTLPKQTDLRHRSMAQMVQKFGSDPQQNAHIVNLALQLFDQTQSLHHLSDYEREILEHAAFIHDIGQYIQFKKYHKHSRYLIKHLNPRGFTDEEILLIGQVVRYHRKATPKKRHKQFKRLSKGHRRVVHILSGILRIAVGLEKTKNQLVDHITCQISEHNLVIQVISSDNINLELWAARRNLKPLEKQFQRQITLEKIANMA